LFLKIDICVWLFSEADTAASDNKPSEEEMPNHQSGENAENATVVILPENNAAVKFAPDGDAGTVDIAASQNGPTDGSSSASADAVVKAETTDKDQKAKKEKLDVVGIFDLVKFLVCDFLEKMCIVDINLTWTLSVLENVQSS